MKDGLNTRVLVLLGLIALALYSVFPSWQIHSLSAEEKAAFVENNPQVADKAVNFGLDLAGGTSVVVELDSKGLEAEALQKALQTSLEILRNRVDQFGLSEPQITTSGLNRITADLAGVTAERARELIGTTAKLEFKLVLDKERFVPVLNRIDKYLGRKAQIESGTDSGSLSSDTPAVEEADVGLLGQTASYDKVAEVDSAKDTAQVATNDSVKLPETLEDFKKRPFTGRFIAFGNDLAIPEDEFPAVKAALADTGVQKLVPYDMQLAFGNGFKTLQDGRKVRLFFGLKKRPEMGGEDIIDANTQRLNDGINMGQLSVNLKFGGIGSKKFAAVTGNNVNNQLAIVLDGQVISAPNILGKIAGGSAQITGLDDFDEANQLAVVLRAGALPVQMEIVELRSVGPSLGAENVNSGVRAAVVGILIVIAFMLVYYMGSGINATVGLLFNMTLLAAVMSMFNATLTLPGIAGIILTIGMAVDGNVLIFERIREELRAGRSARVAVQQGFDKAFSSVFDSNLTTFLTSFILYQVGSGPIRGFGLTLMIGIATTMFCTLYLSRTVYMLRLKNDDSSISMGNGLNALNNSNINILGLGKKIGKVSMVLAVVGLVLVFTKGLNLGIDYTGGHIVTIEVAKGVDASQIRSTLKASDIAVQVKPITVGAKDLYQVALGEDKTLSAKVMTSLATHSAEIRGEELVGPSIGKDLRWAAFKAIFWSLLIIVGYIWIRFGRHGLGFGLGAILTLTHDVLVTLGIFSILGLEIDATFIAAILTLVGYSLNDTIVVFDRIRENTENLANVSYNDRVNTSVNQSFSRTVITSGTTLFTTAVIAIFGGDGLATFAWALTIGVLVGTYSSVFVSAPFVNWWVNRRVAPRK